MAIETINIFTGDTTENRAGGFPIVTVVTNGEPKTEEADTTNIPDQHPPVPRPTVHTPDAANSEPSIVTIIGAGELTKKVLEN